jgi:four helix bundle protein
MDQIPSTKPKFDLEERTLAFAKDVIRLCRSVQKDEVTRGLISQLVRASGSVGANYREANDASSKKDFCNRVKISLREAKEAHFWLQLLQEAAAEPGTEADFAALLSEAIQLRKILSSIIEKVSPRS